MNSKLPLPLIFLLGVTSVWPARAQNVGDVSKGLATSTDTAAQTSTVQAAPVAEQTNVGEFSTDVETVSTAEGNTDATRSMPADLTAGTAEVVAVPDVAAELDEVVAELSEMMTLGWIETIQLGSDLGLEMKAKLDTGADSSSLDARNIRRVRVGDELYVRFTIKHPETGRNIELRKPYLRRIRIKRHGGNFQRRYVVHMNVCIGGHSRGIDVNLVDRAYFDYPMLLGRSALRDLAIVDPNSVLTTEANCWDNTDRVINYDAVVDPDEVPVEDDIDGEGQRRKPKVAEKDEQSGPNTDATNNASDDRAIETTPESAPDNVGSAKMKPAITDAVGASSANDTVQVESAPVTPDEPAEVVIESTDGDIYNINHDETDSVVIIEAPLQPGAAIFMQSDPAEISEAGAYAEANSVVPDESDWQVIDQISTGGPDESQAVADEIVEEQAGDAEDKFVGDSHDAPESVEPVDGDLPSFPADVTRTGKPDLPDTALVKGNKSTKKSGPNSTTIHSMGPEDASALDADATTGIEDETDLITVQTKTTVEPEGARPAQ